MSQPPPLVLASASPQRRAILERLGIFFRARPSDIAEIEQGEPGHVAVENALAKARAARVADRSDETVLGVDTLVALDARIYGKPPNERAARETLAALSGQWHSVLSGVAVLCEGRERLALAQTEVHFRELSEELIDWYLASNEWKGRAGGYAIQGIGAVLVREIHGDYENVVGLPVATLLEMCPQLIDTAASGKH